MEEFKYQDCIIEYQDVGAGPLVVLLHGFAETGAVWQQQVDFLKEYFRVIVPELPGANWKISSSAADLNRQTDISVLTAPLYDLPIAMRQENKIETATIYQLASSVDAMADALAALLQEKHLEPTVVLGHSMGGYVTLALAEKHPQLLKAFGLIHSTAFADTEEKKQTRRKGIDFIKKNGAEVFFKTSAPGLFSDVFKQKWPELIQKNIELAVKFEPEILIANYEAMIARPDRTNVLSGSGVPVLFIIGKEDKAAPAADVLQQVHLPPVSYFHLLEGVAHMGMWEAPDEVDNIIYKFLEDCG